MHWALDWLGDGVERLELVILRYGLAVLLIGFQFLCAAAWRCTGVVLVFEDELHVWVVVLPSWVLGVLGVLRLIGRNCGRSTSLWNVKHSDAIFVTEATRASDDLRMVWNGTLSSSLILPRRLQRRDDGRMLTSMPLLVQMAGGLLRWLRFSAVINLPREFPRLIGHSIVLESRVRLALWYTIIVFVEFYSQLDAVLPMCRCDMAVFVPVIMMGSMPSSPFLLRVTWSSWLSWVLVLRVLLIEVVVRIKFVLLMPILLLVFDAGSFGWRLLSDFAWPRFWRRIQRWLPGVTVPALPRLDCVFVFFIFPIFNSALAGFLLATLVKFGIFSLLSRLFILRIRRLGYDINNLWLATMFDSSLSPFVLVIPISSSRLTILGIFNNRTWSLDLTFGTIRILVVSRLAVLPLITFRISIISIIRNSLWAMVILKLWWVLWGCVAWFYRLICLCSLVTFRWFFQAAFRRHVWTGPGLLQVVWVWSIRLIHFSLLYFILIILALISLERLIFFVWFFIL